MASFQTRGESVLERAEGGCKAVCPLCPQDCADERETPEWGADRLPFPVGRQLDLQAFLELVREDVYAGVVTRDQCVWKEGQLSSDGTVGTISAVWIQQGALSMLRGRAMPVWWR